MNNNLDRSWMYDRMSDGNINSAFLWGVESFLQYVFSQPSLVDRGMVRCPCANCRNSKFLEIDEIRCHLYGKGFVPHYYVWFCHGETMYGRNTEPDSYDVGQSSGNVDQGRWENTYDADPSNAGRLRDLVDDAFAGQFANVHNDTTTTDDEPTDQARAFFAMLQKAEEKIHDGIEMTVLEWVSIFMEKKIKNNWTEIGANDALEVSRRLLSFEDRRKIPDTFYRCKRLLKDLGMECIKLDVCENNCFLYYGVYESVAYTACPTCEKPRWKERSNTSRRAKRIPRKRLWYFPLTPRLQRLYMSRKTAEHMTWHLKCRGDNDTMIHPAAAEAWKTFDETYPFYAEEARNVRLGLCTDGFCPWGNSSNAYSCWPVFVTPYNLPPGMCMRKEYIFLSLLISGPSSPGQNIDVLLRPLIDELKKLWEHGAPTYDSYRKDTFVMRAHVMWTISDFPAYGMLSQWSTHGKFACPYCMENTKSFWLANGKKHSWFDCHRRFLPPDHEWRWNTTDFTKGRPETDAPLHRRLGPEMWNHVSTLPDIPFGITNKVVQGVRRSHNWQRRSIFWELPYWQANMIRHNLDVMHCEKNFFDNIKNTVMDDPEKTKDNLKARRDLALITNRSTLFAEDGDKKKRKARYCLSRDQKIIVCNWLRGIKFPDGFVSNLARCVQMPQLRITGMKSHDCHVFMQRLIPIAFRDFLPDFIWEPLVEVSLFFRALCARGISRQKMEELESSIVLTMCKLERIFPPAFFDSMEHLAIHLPWEAKVGGPVHYRWMYPFERQMFDLKKSVKNKNFVEGSICQNFLLKEITQFLEHYFEPTYETRSNRPNRNEVALNIDYNAEFSIFHRNGEVMGSAKRKQLSTVEYNSIELYVLLNCPEMEPWLRMFDESMCNGVPQAQIQEHRNMYFVQWMKQIVGSGYYDVDIRVVHLVHGPCPAARKFTGYKVNGCRFQVADGLNSRETNNSGVYVKGATEEAGDLSYYGLLREVVEVDYFGSGRTLTVVLFKCDWFDLTTGIKVHPSFKLVDIDPTLRLATNETEPFILASQAQQACYFPYACQRLLARRGWWAVCTTQARHIIDTSSLNTEAVEIIEDVEIFQDNTPPDFTVAEDVNPLNVQILADNQLITVENDPTYDEEPELPDEDHHVTSSESEPDAGAQDQDSDPDYE